MAQSARPISPHLQIYKPQLTSVLSITHRMTMLDATVQIANSDAPATEIANSLGCSINT